MSLTVPLKVPVADFAALQTAHPDVSRSGIVRGLLYACAEEDASITTTDFSPPKAAAWTTISMDPLTEVLLTHGLTRYNASSISALLYAAVRDPSIVASASAFLRLHPVEQKRRAKRMAHRISGIEEKDTAPDEEEIRDAASAHKRMTTYLHGQIERTRASLEAAMKDHAAAKSALDAYMVVYAADAESA